MSSASPARPADAVAHAGPYQGYVYAYPHKTAYRPLEDRPSLTEVWAEEPTDHLFLYLHIPFCEMRCGFCNLFTRTGASEELVDAYLGALARQARVVRDALSGPRFVAAAVGGGTPTYLDAAELTRMFDLTERIMGADLRAVPVAVETSPATATADRLAVLAERGTTRVSIGVQSFVDAEARAAVRPQRRQEVETALGRIREAGFETLNIDLIYGIDGQTEASWRYSLDAALAWKPEEIYLYPLYVRPLTGLGRRARDWDDHRLTLYRAGRDHLLAAGYEQVSMRMFRLPGRSSPAEYTCQSDGMVGLGCGARSYTSALHHSYEYAVGAGQVRAIIDDYVRLETEGFAVANMGFRLDDDDRRRRHLIQSLLQAEGLDPMAYRARFGAGVETHFGEELERLAERGLLERDAPPPGGTARPGWFRLTAEGLAHSDAIGPGLFSGRVRALMAGHEER
ncbi:STM4012 family radical SAM protein [Streptosporangium sp. NBC_01755]|uniref:STM4012 family radical SAM protein n=1 Tax=unclassified Streptosporangium TaxID=2632669 RepID=UPI002DDA6163|nr:MULTISPECIES: STM4012 family radical SAM protein [unclassified Streptosporangium]WSA28032.1 STM4012 family radical SAM protein [Streptosporangium sp. NBC_01810]WSD00496.1 STM4012 family radical SAM protein [Streptosporangium sp. NBC_01755]